MWIHGQLGKILWKIITWQRRFLKYMESITFVDNRHAEKAFKNFSNKNIGNCLDLYVQSDTLLLADIFENFGNKCIVI